MNEHRGIVNRLLWMQDEYGLTAGDRVLQKAFAANESHIYGLTHGKAKDRRNPIVVTGPALGP